MTDNNPTPQAIEPSEAMVEAGALEFGARHANCCYPQAMDWEANLAAEAIWRAMVAAMPSSPAPEVEALIERAKRYRKDNLRETTIGFKLIGELCDALSQSSAATEAREQVHSVEQQGASVSAPIDRAGADKSKPDAPENAGNRLVGEDGSSPPHAANSAEAREAAAKSAALSSTNEGDAAQGGAEGE